jgi:hypothetical protein
LPGLAVARAAGLLLDWTATVGGSHGALPPGSRGGSRDALPPDTVGRFGRLTFGRPLLLAEKFQLHRMQQFPYIMKTPISFLGTAACCSAQACAAQLNSPFFAAAGAYVAPQQLERSAADRTVSAALEREASCCPARELLQYAATNAYAATITCSWHCYYYCLRWRPLRRAASSFTRPPILGLPRRTGTHP